MPGPAMSTITVPAGSDSRRQLTLFVGPPWRTRLEAFRLALDPVQASLIAAHVTLCREDEIGQQDPAAIFRRVAAWSHGPLDLSFGSPRRINGHGVLLPCEQGSGQFQRLRRWLLQDPDAREHGAHLTLAHPRNARAPGNTDAALAAVPAELQLQFSTVALIEQHGAAPWRVLHEATLGSHGRVSNRDDR